MAKIKFLGANGTTTGSKHLFEHQGFRIMVDCGLFQGLKELRKRNWEPFPEDVRTLDAIVLTHAHLDHCGYLPRLVREGFDGPVYCTDSTADLAEIILLDSAHIQESDAKWAKKKGYSKHKNPEPLYDKDDALKAIRLFTPIEYKHRLALTDTLTMWLNDAGHILGSSFVSLEWMEGESTRKILFSGDVGRPNMPILRDPTRITEADYMVLESTYGDRLHGQENPAEDLARVINDSVTRGGTLIVPSFAVGRTQELLFTIRELEEKELIPALDVFVDSPMATRVTKVVKDHDDDHDLESSLLEVKGVDIVRTRKLKFTVETKESIELNQFKGPGIIISASGMLSGGRILHHLANRLPNPATTVLFIGYQAIGTRGRAILEGARSVKIHGKAVTVGAHIEQISAFSAHADYQEMLAWLRGFTHKPERTFIVHGEPHCNEGMASKINAAGFATHIPKYLEEVDLS